ncbi:amino acid adenylation domain-containing protein [Opitutaceae bacterium]|nr:amino acid adenylation domain-containing protein [Opitutaceae bacterium]
MLYQLPQSQRLLLVAHHLVVDGVSWRRLVEDLETAIIQQEGGDEISLGARPLPIDQWSRATMERSDPSREYWLKELAPAGASWPAPDISKANTFGESITMGSRLSLSETNTLTTTANQPFTTEVEDLLLLALAKALYQWHGGTTTRVMMEGHGRQGGKDISAPEETVGWFTSLYPFRLELIGSDWQQQLRNLKEKRRAVPDHGNGFGPTAYLHQDDELRQFADSIPLSFNFLGRFEDSAAGRLAFADESSGTPIGSAVERMHEIDAGAAITGGRLSLSLTVGANRYPADHAQRLLDYWHQELITLTAHCATFPTREKTPADFTSQILSLREYDDLLAHYGWISKDVDDVSRLSPMQAGLLFQSVIDQESSAYFVQMAYRLRGHLDADRFVSAWQRLPQRHAILRTSFLHEDLPEPLQVVWRERPVEINVIDLRNSDQGEQAAQIERSRNADLNRPFDLARDPLWRVTVWQLANDLNEIVWSYHHVLLDGWSLGLVHRDLFDLYDGRATLAATTPYQNYIKWLARNPPERARSWWTEHLAGFDEPSSVPEEAAASNSDGERGEFLTELDRELSQKLRELAADSGATLATLMQAAWGIWLGGQNRTDDVVFGAIVSGRPSSLEGVENMVGLFICAVPVRIQFGESESFVDLLERVQNEALAAEPHHHLPLAEIQTLTPRGRDLFDHILVFENYPLNRTARENESAPLTIEHIEAHDRTHYKFDLTIDPGETLSLRFGFDPSSHDSAQVARISAQLQALLRSLVTSPRSALNSRSMLPDSELDRVLRQFNQTQFPCPTDITLLELFEEALRLHADHDAVVQGDHTLTYRELHLRADDLAARLQTLGVLPEIMVGLCVGRTPAMIIGVLGIMKAGGAYLPLDPNYPEDRLSTMLEDAGVNIIVTSADDKSAIPSAIDGITLLDIDDVPAESPVLKPTTLRPHHLAYTIYTSGSTGRPKGVAVEHRSLVNAAFAWRQGYGIGPGGTRPRILQMASLSFDVFAGDLIRALTNGGTLYLCDADTRIDPEGLTTLLQTHRITQFESTPGLILPLMEYVRESATPLPDLNMLILGSDTLRCSDYRNLVQEFGQDRRIINSYGVTEATIDTCFFEEETPSANRGEESTPIGRPMANQRVYILDSRNTPVGIGTPGELFIGGNGLARGYHQQAELTAEKFPEIDPGDGPQRLYRTGDLARWRNDGTLQFLGRNDRQIKIRGVRIELGEIEAVLRDCPSVKDALVDVFETSGNSELVAFVVPEPDSASDTEIWRNHLLGTLSSAMIPSHWMEIERIPLSPNGKVDRRALLSLSLETLPAEIELVAARTNTEKILVPIWAEVLQSTHEDVTADFFALGGHSLKAMQLLSRIKRDLGIKIPMRAFFEQASIAGLARLVDESETPERANSSQSISIASPADHYPLSFAQQRLWLLHQLGGETAYNMPEAYRIKGPVEGDALETAICGIISRHEALRTGFEEMAGDPVQIVFEDVPFSINRIDLTAETDAESQARELADHEAAAPFDLRTPPLLRGTLIKLNTDDWVYLQTIHHIVGDGWSGNVLYREIFALYEAAISGRPEPLPPLRIHYKDFAVWQKNTDWGREESYWVSALRGAPDSLRLPYDFPADSTRDFRGNHEKFQLSPESTERLRQVARDRKTTVANTLLAVFDLLLFQLTKQTDFCIGVSHANRNHPDLENLLGFFVNLLPVRVQLDDQMDFSALLDQVVNNSDAAFEHQDFPFDLMVQRLNPDRASNRQPLLNVVYAFQNFGDVHVDVGDSAASPVDPETKVSITPFDHTFHTSKFDLTLFVSDDGETLDLTLEYDSGLFKPTSIRRYLTLINKFSRMIAVPSASA